MKWHGLGFGIWVSTLKEEISAVALHELQKCRFLLPQLKKLKFQCCDSPPTLFVFCNIIKLDITSKITSFNKHFVSIRTELPVHEWSFPVGQGSGGQCVRHIPDHFCLLSTNIYNNISVHTNISCTAPIDILSEVGCTSYL